MRFISWLVVLLMAPALHAGTLVCVGEDRDAGVTLRIASWDFFYGSDFRALVTSGPMNTGTPLELRSVEPMIWEAQIQDTQYASLSLSLHMTSVRDSRIPALLKLKARESGRILTLMGRCWVAE